MKKMSKQFTIIFSLLRLSLGWVFLWSFVDKLFGLGYNTSVDQAWVRGISPTNGFLTFGSRGPLAGMFRFLAGNPVVDWLFMVGLLGVGVALILGIGLQIAGYAGAIQMILIFLAALPPEYNPLVDEHIIYILVLLGFTQVSAGDYLGFGKRWARTSLVQRFPWLA